MLSGCPAAVVSAKASRACVDEGGVVGCDTHPLVHMGDSTSPPGGHGCMSTLVSDQPGCRGGAEEATVHLSLPSVAGESTLLEPVGLHQQGSFKHEGSYRAERAHQRCKDLQNRLRFRPTLSQSLSLSLSLVVTLLALATGFRCCLVSLTATASRVLVLKSRGLLERTTKSLVLRASKTPCFVLL